MSLHSPGRQRPHGRLRARHLLLLLLLAPASGGAEPLVIETPPLPAGLFLTAGLGVVDLEPGTGLDIPIGLTALAPRRKLMATVTVADFAFLQSRELRYGFRRYGAFDYCIDTVTGRQVHPELCRGKTNALRSFSVDLNVLPVEMLFVADRPGVLHLGPGWRGQDPRTVYGTIGMFFPSPSGNAVGARLAMGREFIFLGFTWGRDLRRLPGL